MDIMQYKLFHYLRVIDRAIVSNIHLKLELSNCTCLLHHKPQDQQFLSHLRDLAEKFTCFWCYDKLEHPTLMLNGTITKFIQFSCADGTCSSCGSNSIPALNNYSPLACCNEWYHAPRPGEKTQLKLGSFKYTIKEIANKTHNHLPIAITHQAHLR